MNTTKIELSEAIKQLAIADVECISNSDYKRLLEITDIKFHVIDYFNNSEAMHVLVTYDAAESMYTLSFVHIAADSSNYQLTVVEVSSSLHDIIQVMSEQLIIDLCETEASQ